MSESTKADYTKLFRSGFTPEQLPTFGIERDTTRRYYREWRASGGKVAWWRRVLARILAG